MPQELSIHTQPPHGMQPAASEGSGRDAASGKGLGVASIVFMVVAAAAPLTVVVTAYPLNILFAGNIGLPLYLVVCALALLLFCVGLNRMGRHVPGADALYSYVAKGLGGPSGTGAAFMAILGYLGAYIGLTAYTGYATANLITRFTGFESPWWMWSLICAVFVAALGYLNVEVGAKVLAVLLILEFAVVIVLDVFIWIDGGAEALSTASFDPALLLEVGAGLGIVLAMGSYLGFEATVVFRREARDPDRTIPRATVISILLIAVFYTVSAWAIVGGLGGEAAVSAAAANPGGAVFELTSQLIGPVARDMMQVLLQTSLLAAILAFHNVIARYIRSLGSLGLLPRGLGAIHPRFDSPARASVVLSGLLLAAIVLTVIFGLDPVTQVYGIISATAAVGIVALLALTSLAIVVHFLRIGSTGDRWGHLIAPVLSFLTLGTLTVTTVVYFPAITGSAIVAYSICGALALVYVIGAGVAVHAKRSGNDVYAVLIGESPVEAQEKDQEMSIASSRLL